MSIRMRIGAALTATVFGCAAGVFGTAGGAAAATATTAIPGVETTTVTGLPFVGDTIGDMVVDAAAGRIFVSGGGGSTYVEVLNLNGQIVGQITGQQDPGGLAVSADGSTLYVADAGSASIAVVNAATLKQTAGYATVDGAGPLSLALMGGDLVYSSGSNDIGEVDLATGTASLTGARMPFAGAKLATSPAAPGVLVAGISGMTEPFVEVFTLESGTLTPTAETGQLDTADECELEGMAISADGKSLDVACGLSYGLEVSLSDLGNEGTYDTGGLAPASVAVSSSGQVLFGESELLGTTADMFEEGVSAPVGQFDAPELVNAQQFQVAWGANDGAFYEIEQNWQGTVGDEPFSLVTTHAATSITIAAPSVVIPGENYQVTGRVLDGDAGVPGVHVNLTASGLSSQTSTLTTDASGTFTLDAVGLQAGWSTTYTATLQGTYGNANNASPGIGPVSTTVTPMQAVYPLKPTSPVHNPVRAPAKAAAVTGAGSIAVPGVRR